ncbi:hypothetical protein ACVFYP_13910 [Roseomonas sp. F4]
MPYGLLGKSAVVLPPGSTGLCLTLVFDWLKLLVAEAATPAGIAINATRCTARMTEIASHSGLATRHARNRTCVQLCALDDVISSATVYSAFFTDQSLNQGQGRFFPTSPRWKDWVNAADPDTRIRAAPAAEANPAYFLFITRQGMSLRAGRIMAPDGSMIHALGVLYFAKQGVVLLYDPNHGEFIMKTDCADFWTKFRTDYGSKPRADFMMFRYRPDRVLYGTVAELAAAGQITPFVRP